MKKLCLMTLILLLMRLSNGQTILFDFENAPYQTSLPIVLSSGGITGNFSANPAYYNYSIQSSNVLGFTPAGFTGLCIYPNTIYPCDLLVSFDRALQTASILYAPEEYATDSSCTMRMTALYGNRVVGTTTYEIAQPGTWPSGTLSFTGNEPFTRIIVHYDKAPATGGDYGPIFMADNLAVTPWTAPYVRADSIGRNAFGHIVLTGVTVPFGSVTVTSTTSLSQSFVGPIIVAAAGDGSYQFEDPNPGLVRFYRVSYP